MSKNRRASARQNLIFPVKSEQAANLHRGLAISTNHAKASGYHFYILSGPALGVPVATLNRKEAEIKLWHDSLDIQSAEYARRFEELDKREYEIKVKEHQLKISKGTDVVINSDKTS